MSVWFITGCSSGFGRYIAQRALASGAKVIATARKLDAIRDLESENCRILVCDVTSPVEELERCARDAIAFFGGVDVVVNNAGYGLVGSTEEIGAENYLTQYKTNVFGVLNVTNAFLPHLRECQTGTIVIIGSRSAWKDSMPVGFLGAYRSAKAAVRAISETWQLELAPFGIRTLLVEPGSFRTENIAGTYLFPGRQLPAYAESRKLVEQGAQKLHKSQLGNPLKAAEIIVDVVRGEGVAKGRPWVSWLALGSDVDRDIRGKCKQIIADLDAWSDVVRSTDYAEEDGATAKPAAIDFRLPSI